MAFETYGASQSTGTKSDIDWNALNTFVVEAAGLQEPETLPGYIVGIVDLGTQEQPDSENPFTGSAEDEEKLIEDKPNTYFKDGIDPNTRKPCRLICWPNKPVQSVAVAIDFPSIMVDKGQFFGESNPQPLRMWLGDTFYLEGSGMVIARPTPLKVNTKLGDWSFDVKHLFYKMAVASKLIKQGEAFVPNDIDRLLGKSFLFNAQVFMRKGKDKKEYFTEKVKFVSGLMKGQQECELVNEPFQVGFFSTNNSPEALKQLRNHVVNTIKRAKNYQGSAIQKQLEAKEKSEQKPKDDDTQDVPAPAPKRTASVPAKVTAKKAPKPPVDDDDDDSIPF